MNIELELQIATECNHFPDKKKIETWILIALQQANISFTLPKITLRVVSPEESQQLNSDFRGKNKPTNVLSFPFEPPEGINIPEMDEYLGDLALCAKLVEQEANKQLKSIESHWAHLVIHGVLHLLEFDHIEDDQAEEMELLEIAILANCGFSNPYVIR